MIAMENMLGYIRIKKDGATPDQAEVYLDGNVVWKESPAGALFVGLPDNVLGVLYANPLRVEFPQE